MNLRDALRLQPGDQVLYGNTMWTQKSARHHVGVVRFVTARGGIRVDIMNEDGIKHGSQEWVPYHHVVRVEKRSSATRWFRDRFSN
jgi:hypothetical protein